MHASGESFRKIAVITVREMRTSDVSALSSILKEGPEASAWSADSLATSALSGTAWVAEQEGDVIGFLIGRGVADEFEILNLAVARAYRRRGIATSLLQAMTAWLQTKGTRRVYLEVRASNEPALAFYMPLGFQPCGRRREYYRDPVEDAIVLRWDHDQPQ